MSKTRKIIIACITAALVVAVIVMLQFLPQAPKKSASQKQSVIPYQFVIDEAIEKPFVVQTKPFVAEDRVRQAFATNAPLMECYSFRAGIVNHHALAADLIAQSARLLKKCRPDIETIVIISPDHFYRGAHSITTANPSYETSSVTIKTNEILLNQLRQEVPVMGFEQAVFLKEHGIAALIPFYAHEFPDVEILPVTVKGRISEEDADLFIKWLEKVLQDSKTMVLISADMSHYLDKEQALKNDQITLEALDENNATFFATASDDYIDSGVQVSLLLRALKNTTWHLSQQKISTDYTNDQANTTSYITGFWK
ncbi:MAG TPA: AmmeMemoRadiSam system protein B [bacterium]|nr:AmmeMemoRadiSam system protein B [bacterium]